MWYPATITTAATAEPVSLEEAKRHVRALDFDDDDEKLSDFISAARDHIEKYCNTRFASQTVTIKCDSFTDFARFPEAPVASITSIAYVDTNGATQTLSTDVYELRADGLEASIVTKFGQVWPTIQRDSRITVVAAVGYDTAPPAVKHALLVWLSDANEMRENAAVPDWTALDSLLCNFRRGA